MHRTAAHSTATGGTATNKLILKPIEVGELLGVSERYVYRLIELGELDFVWQANRKMVLRTEVEAYIAKLQTAAGDGARRPGRPRRIPGGDAA